MNNLDKETKLLIKSVGKLVNYKMFRGTLLRKDVRVNDSSCTGEVDYKRYKVSFINLAGGETNYINGARFIFCLEPAGGLTDPG